MTRELSTKVIVGPGQEVSINMPGLLVDWQLRELSEKMGMIEPCEEGIDRPGKISYGLTSIGYDVRLGTKFRIFSNTFCKLIDPKAIDESAFVHHEGEYCDIPPHGYILGQSVEYFRIPRDIGIVVIGKSTYARCGITINVTPGEPEWEGRWTIELENASSIPARVYANEGIMQCLFYRTAGVCERSYKDKKGKYQGDKGVRYAHVKQCQLCGGRKWIESLVGTDDDNAEAIRVNCPQCQIKCPYCHKGQDQHPLNRGTCEKCHGTGWITKE